MGKVVHVHVVVVDKHSSVQVLGLEVEANVVEVSWVDLIVRRVSVCEVLRQRKRQVSCLEKRHLTLEVLILAGIVVRITVPDADSSGRKEVVGS